MLGVPEPSRRERRNRGVEGRTPDVTNAQDAARAARSDLAALAREFSPRVEVHGPGLVTLDAHGLERLFGDAPQLGAELRRAAADRGLPARIALASTRTAAWLVAHARAGLTIVAPGDERRWLSPLPLHLLEHLAAAGLGVAAPPALRAAAAVTRPSQFSILNSQSNSASPARQQVSDLVALLKRWGLRTLGDFTALDGVELSERLGQEGLWWQSVARGEEVAPLVPDAAEERFEETLDLEWPIEGLQPLSFVFGRLFDALSARLVERDRAAAVLHIELQLVTREVERRSLQLPAPMRDGRVLRTLAILNLEAHPVSAGIDRVTVRADPVPGRVIQCSLLTRALPFPEQLSTLLARLGAVMGDGRCGMAALVDSYRPGAFDLKPFAAEWHKAGGGRRSAQTTAHVGRTFSAGTPTRQPRWGARSAVTAGPSGPATETTGPEGPITTAGLKASPTSPHDFGCAALALRRFRLPVPASVVVKDSRPVRVVTARADLAGGGVEACAGPWRTSGEWWRVADARVQVDAEASGDRPSEGRASGPSDRAHAAIGWNRDEWDVHLADGGLYRIYRDRDRERWFVDGVID